MSGWAASLSGVGEPEPLVGEQVTPEYFDVLGARPALGRAFRSEDGLPDAHRVVIISDGLWARRFGRDPAVIGRMVTLSGEPHEIVGVAPGKRELCPRGGPVQRSIDNAREAQVP